MAKWPRTLADEPELMRELRVFPNAPFNPVCSATEVLAPCCGRRCPADCVLDVRHIPGTIVHGGGWKPPKDHEWLCDGCRDRMFRDPKNGWTPSRLFELCGAPADALDSLRAREWRDAAERESFARNEWIKPEELYEMFREQLALIRARQVPIEPTLEIVQ